MTDNLPDIRITLAKIQDASAVLAFEAENRAFFEQWVAGRGDAYYDLSAVKTSLERAQHAAQIQSEFHYLAWAGSEIVGRVTLRHIEREHFNKAELGYRFSQRHTGRGYASQAVEKVLEQAFKELRLWRVEASVIENNLGSRAIMRKNGFRQYGHAHAAVLRHGKWMDLLHFEKHATPAPQGN
ncbi:MAG: GNAT family N-acetyltransferase [Burkholderiales bacterium]|nr:GNAT family N-acetyltransferase [Burkholderiales bacterium]